MPIFPQNPIITSRLSTSSALTFQQMDTNFGNLTASNDAIISIIKTASYVDSSNVYYPGTSQSFHATTSSFSKIGTADVTNLNVINTATFSSGIILAGGTLTGTSSFATTASHALTAVNSTTAVSASFATTASYVSGSVLLVTNNGVKITGSLVVSGSNTLVNVGPLTTGEASNVVTGLNAMSQGSQVSASGIWSHAEGLQTTAIGTSSHAEGWQTTAIGAYSHAEGWRTTAIGSNSHAEGDATRAYGDGSHSEGYATLAFGQGSHAEGYATTARGRHSTTAGWATVTTQDGQVSVGTYNQTCSFDSAFIVGVGVSDGGRENGLEIYNADPGGTYMGKIIVRMPHLPTSAAGLPSGSVWRDTSTTPNTLRIL